MEIKKRKSNNGHSRSREKVRRIIDLNGPKTPVKLSSTIIRSVIEDTLGLKDPIKIITSVTTSSFGDFYVKVGNIEEKNMICLLCAFKSAELGYFNKVKRIKRDHAQNLRTHIREMHADMIEPLKNRIKTILKIKEIYPSKVFWGQVQENGKLFVPRNSSKLKYNVKDQEGSLSRAFKLNTHKKARMLQTLWLMMKGYPGNVVEGDYFRSFLRVLDKDYDCQGRTSQYNRELLVFGFCLDLNKERIEAAADQFKGNFMTLQCDAWTTQSLIRVLGISISFFDVKIARKITIF